MGKIMCNYINNCICELQKRNKKFTWNEKPKTQKKRKREREKKEKGKGKKKDDMVMTMY